MTRHFMVAENFLKNGLDVPLRPIIGINHGRNAPLIVANDNNIAFFDYLISQHDRAGTDNWGYAPDGMPVLIDNATSFQAQPPMIFSRKLTQFIPDQTMLDNARKLNMEMLKDIDELSEAQKKDFLARRDNLIRLIDLATAGK